MEYTKQSEIEAFLSPPPHQRRLKVLMGPSTNSIKNFSVGMTLLPPDNTSSYHAHSGEEEVWFVISGRGFVAVGDEKMPVEPDMLIYIPPFTKHQLINTGDETLKVLWVFSPPGPEKEFITKKRQL